MQKLKKNYLKNDLKFEKNAPHCTKTTKNNLKDEKMT
jgi:hypothetical protein